MSGTPDWMQWNVPVRFTASMRSHASTVMSVNSRNSSRPALVTTIATGPSSVRAFAIALSTAARSVTSTCTAIVCAPLALPISSAARCASSLLRSSRATRCPPFASLRLMARPIPDAAPVTTATRLMWAFLAHRARHEAHGWSLHVRERAVVAGDVPVAQDWAHEGDTDRAWPARVVDRDVEGGQPVSHVLGVEAEVVAHLPFDADDPEPAPLGREPDLAALWEVAQVSPRLVELRAGRRVDVTRVEV